LDGSESGRPLTMRGAAFLGVGSMVGAGIFALLGEAGAIAGAAVWLSFLIAGIVALFQGYAVAKLGARFPSSGGIVTFLLKGFGAGHVTAIASWLIYFASLIVTAMVSVSFGQYAAALFFGGSVVWAKITATVMILAIAAINIAGAKLVDRMQTFVVIVLLTVFGVFIVVTLAHVQPEHLAVSSYPPAADIISSVALTFFAYLGFSVISFTGGDLPDPGRNLPRAMYLALGLTTVLYVLIALGVFGTLTVQEVVDNGATALAVAAKPTLGDVGFAMMAVTALLATSASVNANLYAATGSTRTLADSGMFPPVFGQLARVGGTRGLVISVAVVLLMTNFVDLTSISSLGSVVALNIFLITSIAAYRLRAQTGSRTWILLVGVALTVLVLLVFAFQTLRDSPQTFTAMVAILLLAIVLDLLWTRARHRRIRSHPQGM
jgi:amino acid transporter